MMVSPVLLMADVSFTTEGLALVGALLGTMAACIYTLWSVSTRWRDDQIADLRQQRDQLLGIVLQRVGEDAVPPRLLPLAKRLNGGAPPPPAAGGPG